MEVPRVLVPEPDRPAQGVFQRRLVELHEGEAGTLLVGLVGVIGIEHRIGQAAGGSHHRHGAVLHRDDLGQAAGLEGAGDHQDIGTGVVQVREFLVVAQLEMTVGVVVEAMLEGVEMIVDGLFRRRAQQDELGTIGQGVEHGMADQLHPLLLIEPAHHRHDGLEPVLQQQALAQRRLVTELSGEVLR